MYFTIHAALPDFGNLEKKQLKAYFQWFLLIVPERLKVLPEMVKATPGFEEWVADFSPDSLNILGKWFAGKVEARKRSAQEIGLIAERSPYRIDIPEDELTDNTFALAYDVGIYFAETLRHQFPRLKWTQISGSKKNIQYGHPALSGFGRIDFSPVHIAITLAYGFIVEDGGDGKLGRLYDVWANIAAKEAEKN